MIEHGPAALVHLDEDGLPTVSALGCSLQEAVELIRRTVKTIDSTRGLTRN